MRQKLLLAAVVVSTFIVSTLITSSAFAQHPTIVDSYKRAYELLDAAVAAHGGAEAMAAARQMRLTARGYEYHMHQSRRIAPLDSTVWQATLMTDMARGRMFYEDTRGYVGGFYYTNRRTTVGSEAFAIDMRNRRYSTTPSQQVTDVHGDVYLLPQFRLLPFYRTGNSSLRSLGRMRLTSGAEVDVITARLPNGGIQTLGFDPVTHRLHALMSAGADPLDGDHAVETEYLGYRMLDGVLLPTEWVTRRGRAVINRYRYTSASLGQQIPDSLLRPPPGFTVAPTPAAGEPVRALGTGLWAVRANGNWHIVAEFRDHVLVVDAGSGSAEVLTRAATLAPNKPVRYVVPTHHHSDHFNGVRRFAAAGVTTVTTPGNVEQFRQVTTAPAPTISAAPVPPVPDAVSRVETISGKRRVFTDGTRVVEIHDVGPTPHAEEMLVAWMPIEGVLFHADMIEAATGQALPGSASPTTVRLAEYIKQRGWNVRVFAGSHGFLDDPSQFDALVKMPVLPPPS
jgi:glyoxylase-like metal-dependent hydrolase (beta-lactamase superfamily II)